MAAKDVMGPVLATAAVAVGAFLVYKWIRRGRSKKRRTFQDQAITDASNWIAEQFNKPPDEVSTALKSLIAGESQNAILEPLSRIECEIVKESPAQFKRTVIVAVNNGTGSASIGRISRNVAWEDMPANIRADFIKGGEKTLCFIVVEKAAGR